MARPPLKPLVVIVGATGTGKSDLAVEIARRHKGEIINGDAMQLYHGLPIITNKISKTEMQGVPHHLLGCIKLDEATWTVGKFVSEALRTIEEIRARGSLPILVGGTHYYTQSLLFHDALADEPLLEREEHSQFFPILEKETSVIYAKLKEVDPVIAERWHPNERRKIQRSLEIYLRTGKPASQLYSEQRLKREKSPVGDNSEQQTSGLRFEPLVLWVHASKDLLYPKLNDRVDKMLAEGLLSEVQQLDDLREVQEANANTAIDQSRGIWVSIGYKEFLDYQKALNSGTRSDTELEQLKSTSIERTQAATRQYANRQIKWIRIKLLNALQRDGLGHRTFLLDGSNLQTWHEAVTAPALDITRRFLERQPLPRPSSLSCAASEMLTPKRSYDLAHRPDLWEKKICETCGTIATTENDWVLHSRSRAHRKAVGAFKRKMDTKTTPESPPISS
ncbi:tRNA dimethylallyltransferase, mitochondrial [Coniothyrium glycines]